MNGVLDGLKALGAARLAAMGAVALGVLGLLLVLRCTAAARAWRCSTATSTCARPAQMADVLEHAAHRRTSSAPAAARSWCRPTRSPRPGCCWRRTGCPAAARSATRSSTAATGCWPAPFQQHINQTRALEGELARTIRTISGVRAARVHLVLPHREPFARDEQEAQASVLLTFAGGRPARPRGRAGDPQPGRRRGAGAAAARTSRSSTAAATCSPAPAQAAGTARRRRRRRGDAARHRTAPRPRGGGDAGAAASAPAMCAPRRRSRWISIRCTKRRNATTPTGRWCAARRPSPTSSRSDRGQRRPSRCRTTCRTPMPAPSGGAGSQEQAAGGDHQLRDQQDRAHASCASSRRSTASASR